MVLPFTAQTAGDKEEYRMTIFLWGLLGGVGLGFIGVIVFSLTRKRLELMLSLALAAACIICFGIDISINPIKDPARVSMSAQELDFSAMVSEYRANEIRAKETYKDNHYIVSAKVVGIEQAGAREGYSGYNVNMVVSLDGEDFSICANFQSDLKEDIMKLNIGDVLTFTGKCVAPELWHNCTIIEVD